jgi:uncharacterized protein YjcR
MEIAAPMYLVGCKAVEIAEACGMHADTIRRWNRERPDRWVRALGNAVGGVNDTMLRYARRAILHNLDELKDAQTARWILERLEPENFGASKSAPAEAIHVVMHRPGE